MAQSEQLALEYHSEEMSPIFSDLKAGIVRGFFRFHAENPHIFDLFRRFSIEVRDSGRAYYSSYAIMERMRWHTEIESKGSEFKINNNHRPCYARLLMLRDPSFKGFFATRTTPGTVHNLGKGD